MSTTWYEDESDQEEVDFQVDQYDLTATPNDFNVTTINSFIDSGAVKIPGFQRNFVWDLKRSSKLIESLIIGLPVPQIFLYEESRNSFLVIDGQQRLMSIYYFIKQRFPRKEKRGELRGIFEGHGKIPDEVFGDDAYFSKFNLSLPEQVPNKKNKFNGLNYSTLGEYKTAFDLRTIRNVIIKQVSPKDDDSSIYEIFNRLNSGGVNLTPQEIRMSLYHSEFYEMAARINTTADWRRLLGLPEPDLHFKDIEFLLRGLAMLEDGENYNPSMVKFLNKYSKTAKQFDKAKIDYLEGLVRTFIDACNQLPADAFLSAGKRFSVTVFESVFAAVCGDPYKQSQLVAGRVNPESIAKLKADEKFRAAAERTTTTKKNVGARQERAKNIIEVRE